MRHVLLESFVWEEANRVPFLIREFSYDRDPSVGTLSTIQYIGVLYHLDPKKIRGLPKLPMMLPVSTRISLKYPSCELW